jgi:hypothetical protein
MKKSINIKKPKDWRVGQTLFNFLEFLTANGYGTGQCQRMADPFYIDDEELEKMYNLFLKSL